jgi:hypothetical protein
MECNMRKALTIGVAALVAISQLGGCSPPGSPTKSGTPTEKEASGARRTAMFPTVLSEKAADSGRTLSSTEIQAELMVDPGSQPDGYRMNSVIVSDGLGSFQLAAPTRYSPPWRYGTPFSELLGEAEFRDPGWTQFWSTKLDDDENPRAVLLDTENEEEVVAILVTVTSLPSEEGDDMARLFSRIYSEIGPVTEAHGVRVNGADGAYVEYAVPADMVGGDEDRIQAQVLIPDGPNEVLWGVTCDVPESLLSEVKPECAEIAATFRPLPIVKAA